MLDHPSETRRPYARQLAPGITTLIEFEIAPGRPDRLPGDRLGSRQRSRYITGRPSRQVVTWPVAQIARITPPPKRPPSERPPAPTK